MSNARRPGESRTAKRRLVTDPSGEAFFLRIVAYYDAASQTQAEQLRDEIGHSPGRGGGLPLHTAPPPRRWLPIVLAYVVGLRLLAPIFVLAAHFGS